MNSLTILLSHPVLVIILVGIFGLIIGSFLNVVIARYPIILDRQWRSECREYLQLPQEVPTASFSLCRPRSHCPHCKTPIRFYHNFPVLSFLFLRGRCAGCKHRISIFYPLVEVLCAVTTIAVIQKFGLTELAVAGLIFSWGLIVLSFIDLRHQILPDTITLSLLWLGLLGSLLGIYAPPYLSILGAVVGYLLLWSVAKLFKLVRKKEGMGHGDFKMLAMLGAWLGVQSILNILLMAVFLSLIVSIILLLTKRIKLKNPIPFGPFLAIAGWVTLFYGDWLTTFITQWTMR